jgi:predicted 3-demethylubiquinone-9 3-methyltransferase (glyoxalase superfamily)
MAKAQSMSGRAKIFTHLWYATEAEEAAKFYASVFPNSRVNGVWTLPTESPSGPAGSVRVVDFTVLGQRFQAMSAGPHHEFNDAMSLVVLCDDSAFGVSLQQEISAFMSDGAPPYARAVVFGPLSESGALCGKTRENNFALRMAPLHS